MDSYVASNGSCFFVGTWNICKNHLFEVGLTPNSDNKALWKLTTVDSFYFIMCEDPAWMQLQWNSIELVEGLVTCDFYTTPEGPTWFWKCLGTAYGDYVWAFTISWSWLLARVWSGPKTPTKTQQRTDMSYKPMDWNKFAWLYEPVLEKRTNNRWLNTDNLHSSSPPSLENIAQIFQARISGRTSSSFSPLSIRCTSTFSLRNHRKT